MPKYKIRGTDILHKNTVFPDGSTIELEEKDAKPLSDYLELIPDSKQEAKKGDNQKKNPEKPEQKQENKTPETIGVEG